jgi:hypothetical protein
VLVPNPNLRTVRYPVGVNRRRSKKGVRTMEQETCSPLVTHLSWGRLEVEGRDGRFKDAKLFPGGAKEWNWSETGTSHEPGIQPVDVEELLDRGATVVVLSRGFHERLRVRRETLRKLEERKVSVYVERTGEAVRLYNELSKKNEKVGALVHSTC